MTDDKSREAFDNAMRNQAERAYQFARLMAGKPNTYRDEQEKQA
jgi:hypothetical protein